MYIYFQLTEFGESALFQAIDGNHADISMLLLNHGADPTAARKMRRHSSCCNKYQDKHPHLELEPLYAAIQNNAIKMISPLLNIYPTMPYSVLRTLKDILFRTDYLREAQLNNMHVALYMKMFGAVLSKPRSLAADCRAIIRHNLKKTPLEGVEMLPLPKSLQKYVLTIA